MKAQTLEVLKNFSGINKSILFREGNIIRTMNAEKTVFAHAQVEDSFTHEFGVFDLTQLLSTWSLLENPDVTYEDKYLLLEEGGTQIKYFYTNTRHIVAAPNKELKLPDTIMRFTLEKTVLEKMLKASSVMKLTNLYITANSVVCKNPDGTGNEYTCPITDFHVEEGQELDEDEFFNINIDAMRLIPDDYEVYVTANAIRFKSQNRVLEYFVVLNN